MDKKTKQNLYLVKWKGYSEDDNTWEPKTNLAGSAELIKAFEAKQKTEEKTATKKAPAKKAAPKKAAKAAKKPAPVKKATATTGTARQRGRPKKV